MKSTKKNNDKASADAKLKALGLTDDEIEAFRIIMANGTLKVSNIETSSGSGTITLGQSGETVTIASGVTQTGSRYKHSSLFEAYARRSVVVKSVILIILYTLVQAMNTEVYDTDSAYDTSTYRFTPQTAGKYNFGLWFSVYSRGW